MKNQPAQSAQQLQQKLQLDTDMKNTVEGKTKKSSQAQAINFFQLFRFAKKADYVLMIVGTIAAIIMGAALPVFALLWGNITDSFLATGQDMVDAAATVLYQFLGIGVGVFFAGFLMFACWMIAGERQAIQCRKEYLKSLLRQQIGWFDMISQSQLASTFATDSFAFQGAIGEKVSTLLMSFGSLLAGFIIAFVKGWLMAFVIIAVLPAIGLGGYAYMTVVAMQDKQMQKDYASAGGRAEQAISAVKTVKMLNGEQYQQDAYQTLLEKATRNTLKFSLFMGLGLGSLFFAMLASYSLGFYYGSILVEKQQPNGVSATGTYTAGDVLIIFFSIVIAGFNTSQLSPAMKSIIKGRQAGARIFKIIDRQPLVKNCEDPKIPASFSGNIKFVNVTFAYPKQKNRKIIDNLSMEFSVSKTALVGQSGCGKSTILQLIMRFYDPDEGRILFDGIDLRQIDIAWLRKIIGYVGQQPVLFATSIKQNLLFGNDQATDDQLKKALQQAQAYNFVQHLEEGINTYVGVGGGQLSGGQKQRIAIARALLKKPQILLLDQATSALDRRNQRLIQATLDSISKNLTTITVAHRIKTIQNSDVIYVLDKGCISERGRFGSLDRYKDYAQEEEYQQQEDDFVPTMNNRKVSQGMTKNSKKTIGRLDMTFSKKSAQTTDKDQIQLSKQEQQKKQQQQILNKYDKQIFGRLFGYARDRIAFFILGIITALGTGVIFPLFSIYFAEMITVLLAFNSPFNSPIEARATSNHNALVFLILGIAMWVGTTIQFTLFGFVGQRITKKIRLETYAKILRMPVPWFDKPRNSSGTLSARLASDCQIVNGLTTTNISILVQNLSTLASGLIIAFVYQWRTSLIALGLIPLMIASGIIQMSFTMGFSDKTDAAYKDSSNLITQAMTNIRTVTSFGYDTFVVNQYEKKLEQPFKLGIRKGIISGILFGLSQFVLFLIFGLLFFFGSLVVRDNYTSQNFFDGVLNMFTAIYAIVFAAMTAGNNSHFLPDVGAAKNSAANLFLIIDSEDQDQAQLREQSKMLTQGCTGDIQAANISFRYQSRKENVFTKLNVVVKSGSKVGFVGASGCGKSTIFQLLLRFYDPHEGKITINGNDIKDYDIHYLRKSIGVVSQEPVLFNDSFRNNIRYNLKEASDADIEQATRKANALSFILGDQNLEGNKNGNKPTNNQEKGFDRSVGIKGSHISGGQKQRVAIARSILREPKILLLDEATSALDSANQKKVQQSLDSIMYGKTTINIAHRLDTIKNSQTIYVFEKGQIVEQGDYDNLISKKGYFYNLERGTQFV